MDVEDMIDRENERGRGRQRGLGERGKEILKVGEGEREG